MKLAIEQMLMGEVSGLEELQEYMEEFDRDWFIGSERDAQWRRSVAAGKPTLFSLGHNTVDVSALCCICEKCLLVACFA